MKNIKLLFLSFLVCGFSYAQVGIGTTDPDPSSMLDVESETQGMLVPRMTTLQRNAIGDPGPPAIPPADGLLVYDTDEASFYYYDGGDDRWVKINSASNQRDNYVLVKSKADLPTPSGGTITLDENTYYEINGTINLGADSIDLNNAYVSGLDANEDVLVSSNTVFIGSTGGAIRNVTITGGTAFNITGGNLLLIQNTIIANMASVGTISNVGTYFTNIVQFVGNSNGVTYSNIDNLLLNNQAWLDSNNGTFETLSGTFQLVEKVSGFSTVNGSDVALDVSTNPNVGKGVIQGTVFSGTTSAPSGYINRYSVGSYTSYNFSNDWTVNAPGIPRESDDVATGNLYYDSSSVVNVTNTTPFKLPVNTDAIRLFRSAEGTGANSENRIIYRGEKGRALNVFTTLSFTATAGTRLAFSIYQNGSLVTGTETIVDVLQTNQRQSVSIIGTVNVVKDDYIEIFVQKLSTGNEQLLVTSYNLLVN